jgi:threonine/homoserine/homoserine lactone efflux protein
MLDAIIKGILVGLFMAISVGPTLFVIIKYSLSYSHKAGLAFVLGVSLSDFMYVTLANVAAPLLEHLKPYERALTIGGGIALMAIGLSGIIKKHKPQRPSAEPITLSGGRYFRIWLGGFLVNTLNPGVIVTWLGIVTLTIGTTVSYRIILFATCLIIILGIDFLKVFLANRIKGLLTPRRIIYMQRFSAACILGIGAFLLIKSFFNIHATPSEEKKDINKIFSYAHPVSAKPIHVFGQLSC